MHSDLPTRVRAAICGRIGLFQTTQAWSQGRRFRIARSGDWFWLQMSNTRMVPEQRLSPLVPNYSKLIADPVLSFVTVIICTNLLDSTV